jgi:asparagine synthase (glutamine-hydrolysing)
MAWSVESRVPFLTRRLATLMLSLPEEYVISNQGDTKHVMRRAMRGIVPDLILDRTDKIGFQTPELTWLRQRPDLIQQALDHLGAIPCLNKEAVAGLCNDMLRGEVAFSWQTWRLINFALWHKMAT